jgi:hypothetical protein
VTEFLVKFQGVAQAEWCSEKDLKDLDPKALQKIRYFQTKPPTNFDSVERVLAKSVSTKKGVTSTSYYVKWCDRTYDDCTWVDEANVPNTKIEAYLKVREPPLMQEKQGPQASEWKNLKIVIILITMKFS